MSYGTDKRLQGQIITKYLEDYPATIGTKTLARIIYRENTGIWASIESVRDVLRYYRGAKGKKLRKSLADKRFTKLDPDSMGLGEGWKEEQPPYYVHKSAERIGIISDTQIPFHNKDAIKFALDYLLTKGIDTLILNGDIIDFYNLSKFQREIKYRNFDHEVYQTCEFLEDLRDIFPKCHIVWKGGNHEDRYFRFLEARAPEFMTINHFKMEKVFNLDELQIQYVQENQFIRAGKLTIIHGHEIKGFGSPVNFARSLWLKAKESVLGGHSHCVSEHIEKNINDKIFGAWGVGCLCQLRPKFAPVNNWAHGFAFVRILDEAGHFRVSNKKIIDNMVE